MRMIRLRRASGKSVPLEEVEARLGIASGKPSGKRALNACLSITPPSREPEERVFRELTCELFVPLGEWMAGVAVLLAE